MTVVGLWWCEAERVAWYTQALQDRQAARSVSGSHIKRSDSHTLSVGDDMTGRLTLKLLLAVVVCGSRLLARGDGSQPSCLDMDAIPWEVGALTDH